MLIALAAVVHAAGIASMPSFSGQQPGGMLRCGASPTLEGLISAPNAFPTRLPFFSIQRGNSAASWK